MQSKIIEEKIEQTVKYPCLMVREDQKLVILFTEKYTGIVLNPGTSPYRIGAMSDSFNMNYFKPFNGTIELSN